MNENMPGEELIKNALRVVLDPEVGVNIVDLGLVYKIEVSNGNLKVLMTMTSQSCPLGPYLRENVISTIRGQFPSLKSVDVHMVWAPPWKPEMMSDTAKKQLGWK